MELSARQKEVLDFIRSHIEKRSYPPTLREIGAALGIKSTNAVSDHLNALVRKGFIMRDKSRSRSITIPDSGPGARTSPMPYEVPVLGRIAAGLPLLAEQNVETTVQVDTTFARRPEGLFALRVVGDSMIEAGIFEGDLVLVRAQEMADQGQIVVALIDDEATVKRFYREPGRIRLQPANADMDPIYINESDGTVPAIQGIVKAVFRKLA